MIYQEARPTILDEVVGNKSAIKALKKELKAEKHSHIYLFSGPSGCGKTTLARILASSFGCLDMNIIEMNAASQRGIDVIRDLEKMSQYSPMGGGARAIILDECHSLTKDAQNAALKLFEDIPSYQYYFLSTTEPGKVLPTIRTRCNQVQVKSLNAEEIGFVLDDACDRLGIEQLDDNVFGAIVKSAEGCPRIALVLLEKINGLSVEDAIKAVHAHKGIDAQVIDLCRVLIKQDWGAIKEIYEEVIKETEPENIRMACLGYLHSCLLKSKSKMEAAKFTSMIVYLKEPTFYSGKAGLLSMLAECVI